MHQKSNLTRWQNIAVSGSRLLNTLLCGKYDQMLSSRAHEQDWWLEMFIDAVFFWEEEPHCKTSYEWEQGLTSKLHEPNAACRDAQHYFFCFLIGLIMIGLVIAAWWLLRIVVNY